MAEPVARRPRVFCASCLHIVSAPNCGSGAGVRQKPCGVNGRAEAVAMDAGKGPLKSIAAIVVDVKILRLILASPDRLEDRKPVVLPVNYV